MEGFEISARDIAQNSENASGPSQLPSLIIEWSGLA
jgi:hypothetical protein